MTHDPLELKVGEVDMEIDLGAEQMIAAERQGQKIAVEVTSVFSLLKLLKYLPIASYLIMFEDFISTEDD